MATVRHLPFRNLAFPAARAGVVFSDAVVSVDTLSRPLDATTDFERRLQNAASVR
jgi:hypothetical protein